ncbi:hypothetical protein PsorP6_013602 [Peronosclerospora sorghi]|uniref:Uncharacterized protein n=1 Tax=Peronosclerospora sorghi TaxID=230839 RepID=A0ACC0VHW4_9STRA|nr:hypothetical protein PsorP6_013602 [Peronosclerospora sorghi]
MKALHPYRISGMAQDWVISEKHFFRNYSFQKSFQPERFQRFLAFLEYNRGIDWRIKDTNPTPQIPCQAVYAHPEAHPSYSVESNARGDEGPPVIREVSSELWVVATTNGGTSSEAVSLRVEK